MKENAFIRGMSFGSRNLPWAPFSEFQAGTKADESPIPVRLTPTTFVSKDYVEEGWEIAVVRYPLREDSDEEIIHWPGELAAVLMKRFHQEQITPVIRDELVIFAKE